MTLEGKDIKYLYREPSHHFWLNDEEIMDNGFHLKPNGKESVRGYFRFADDGTGRAKEKYFEYRYTPKELKKMLNSAGLKTEKYDAESVYKIEH